MNKLLEQLKSNIEYFSNTEEKIAKIILDDPKKFTEYTLGELSEVADVSQGSIVNFAKKFSGGGFPLLKMKVAASFAAQDKKFSIVELSDGVSDVLKKTCYGINEALEHTVAFNDEEVLLAAAELILKANKIEIYGIYRSAALATDLYYQLLEIGVQASFVSDVLTCATSALMLGEKDLVIAISSSGQTKDVIDAVKIAKEKGVSAICLTGNRNSPLAKLSDVVLVAAASGNSVFSNAKEIRFSQLAVLDALCSFVAGKIDDEEKRYSIVNKILNSHSVKD